MNKIDLIIDALEGVAISSCQPHKNVQEALAAARELKDAESKTQQWGNPKYLIEEAVLAEREACATAIRARGDNIDFLRNNNEP
jgi:hypothetical protein